MSASPDAGADPGATTVSGTGAARGSRVAAWIAVLSLVAGLAVAPPWAAPDDIPEGFAARFTSGDLERAHDDGWTAVRPGELIADGAAVRTDDGAELTVAGGAIALAGDTRAVLDDPVVLERGRLLTEVDDVDRAVRVGSVITTGRGAWRVDAGPTERVGVYRGGAGLRAMNGGAGVSVAALEQAELLAGRLPETSLPLRYAHDDAWDARLLASAIAVDREIDRLERSLTAEYGSSALPADFYAGFATVSGADLARVEAFGLADGGGYGPPGAVLVHLTLLRVLTDVTTRSADDVAARALELRRDGATWGLVLTRSGLGADDLRAAVDLAFAEAPPAPPVAEPEPAPGDEPPPGDPDPAPPPPPQPPPDDDPLDDDPADDEPSEPVDDPVDEVDDLADEVIGDLGGLIGDTVGGGLDDLLNP